jgi:hypothetical protein
MHFRILWTAKKGLLTFVQLLKHDMSEQLTVLRVLTDGNWNTRVNGWQLEHAMQ